MIEKIDRVFHIFSEKSVETASNAMLKKQVTFMACTIQFLYIRPMSAFINIRLQDTTAIATRFTPGSPDLFNTNTRYRMTRASSNNPVQ